MALDAVDAAVRSAVGTLAGSSAVIESIDRQPNPYQSSYPLDDIDVRLGDGRSLRFLWKDLSRHALLDAAKDLKPTDVSNPACEILVYSNVLAARELGTPELYGSIVDPHHGRYGMLIERIDGRELYQVGEIAVWQEVARWAARLHARFAGAVETVTASAPVRVYEGRDYFHTSWRALARASATDEQAGALLRIVGRYDEIVRQLLAMPITFIHGEFYASNILVGDGEPMRISPIDWEMAAMAPGPMDLAALTSGGWSADERRAIIAAYGNELGLDAAGIDALEHDVDCCRLHIALQWLGWFGSRQPYWQHRHDWLTDAIDLGDRLLGSA